MTNITSEAESFNPDDELSEAAIIFKYQLDFTKHFGPKYAYGVHDVYHSATSDEIKIYARVAPAHQSTKGATTTFNVSIGKFNVWRKNVKLYSFIS